MNLNTLIDIENLKETFKLIKKNAEKIKEQTKEWLTDVNSNVDSELFSHLLAFTLVYDKKFGFAPDTKKRSKEYDKGTPNLSEIIKVHAAECAEIAALAQVYLQDAGIKSSFFSGEVLNSKKTEFAEKHSFVVIDYKGKEYIFDPANPIRAENKGKEVLMPRLQETDNFREKVGKGKQAYVKTTDVIDKSVLWYGVGDGTYVKEDSFV